MAEDLKAPWDRAELLHRWLELATTGPDIQLTLLGEDDDVTIYRGVSRELGTIMGSSKRHPKDKPDRRIGRLLAQARIYEKAARRLNRQAAGLIKHAEDVKNDRYAKQLTSRIEKANPKWVSSTGTVAHMQRSGTLVTRCGIKISQLHMLPEGHSHPTCTTCWNSP